MKEITMTFLTEYPGIAIEYIALNQAGEGVHKKLEFELGNPNVHTFQRQSRRHKWHEFSHETVNLRDVQKLSEGLLALSRVLQGHAYGIETIDGYNFIPLVLAEAMAYSIEVLESPTDADESRYEEVKHDKGRLSFNTEKRTFERVLDKPFWEVIPFRFANIGQTLRKWLSS